MPDSDLMHWLIGLAAALVVALLTALALGYAYSITRLRLGSGGYVQLGDNNYEDRDGIANEDSIRAFSDTRPRVVIWLAGLLGLGSSIAAKVLVLKGAGPGGHTHFPVLSELADWAEPACWVSTKCRHFLQCPSVDDGYSTNSAHRSSCASSVLFSLPNTGTKPSSG